MTTPTTKEFQDYLDGIRVTLEKLKQNGAKPEDIAYFEGIRDTLLLFPGIK